MPLDEESRQEIGRFHKLLTFWIGVLFIAASVAAGYIAFSKPSGRPSFLHALERLTQKTSR